MFGLNHPQRHRTPYFLAVMLLLALGGCAKPGGPVGPVDPEAPTATAPHTDKAAVVAEKWMVTTANLHASEAGREILRQGGSAIDAAIAAQMVLNLVEPQSSGIGGGAFMIHFDAASSEIATYDGRETAPANANPYMFLDGSGHPKAFYDAVVGGLAVGAPGLLRMLEMAHKEHGRLPWADLFETAIRMAGDGFAVSERLHKLISKDKYLKTFDKAASYFYGPDGEAWPVGHQLVNPELAETFGLIAEYGADAFYTGPVADAIADAVTGADPNPGGLTVADLENYPAIKRDPVCLFYRQWLICGMGPPSSGGLTTLQILGILQSFDLAAMKPGKNGVAKTEAVHLIAEASRLAFADRNTYIADPDFVPVPASGMLDPGYLEQRAKEISTDASIGPATPGMPGIGGAWNFAPGGNETGLSTTHMSIIDGDGNAVSMTSSIENAFGSRLMVKGFLLNNQLTDFAFVPNQDAAPVANRPEAGKRPRSSMAPTMVFDGEGRVVMAVGSPGGSRIIGYVAKTLIAALDWDLGIQRAIDSANFTNRNGSTDLEAGSPLASLQSALEKLGHTVAIKPMASGLHGILAKGGKLYGGADQRREGVALGD